MKAFDFNQLFTSFLPLSETKSDTDIFSNQTKKTKSLTVSAVMKKSLKLIIQKSNCEKKAKKKKKEVQAEAEFSLLFCNSS